MFKSLLILSLFSVMNMTAQKVYVKNYFDNQKMKSEGWSVENQKTDYWYYYYENGKKKEEGHYSANKKVDWWLFYDEKGKTLKKAEYKNNVLNGLCLVYKNGSLVKAERYKAGVKTNEWTSLSDYKKDNTL